MRVKETITLNDRQFEANMDPELMNSHMRHVLNIVLKIKLVQNGGMQINHGQCIYYQNHSPSSFELALERVVGSTQDYDGDIFMLEDWDRREWIGFCDFFESESTAFWTNRFYLSSSNPISYDDRQRLDNYYNDAAARRHFPEPVFNVQCRFRLQLTEDEHLANKVIDVYKISSSESGRRQFRADDQSYTLDSLEEHVHRIPSASFSTPTSETYTSQRTFLHEVGHALGLQHVGISAHIPGCYMSNDGDKICYGISYEHSHNIMGRGETLSWREALPWRTALGQLTNTRPDDLEVHQI